MSKIHFLMKPPKDVYLAFSGGVDSVVLLHNLRRRGYKVTLLFVHHLNVFAEQELEFCITVASNFDIDYKAFTISPFDKSTSLEAFWSNERNKIFQSMDKPVLVGHHLDDAVESHLMAACQGTNRSLDPVNRNVYRPMIINTKKTIIEYANKYQLTYLTDPTNLDPSFNLRNKVRLQLVGNVKACFPGIYTTVKRLIVQKYKKGIVT